MAVKQTQTSVLAIPIPGDDSHNTPWGDSDQVFSLAINSLESQIIASVQQNMFCSATDTGTANAYAIAITPAPVIGVFTRLYFKAVHANTGASTLSVNGGTAKAITKNGTTALAGAEISANQIVQVVFDGTQWQLISQ